jgi:hypothetical protein
MFSGAPSGVSAALDPKGAAVEWWKIVLIVVVVALLVAAFVVRRADQGNPEGAEGPEA